MEDISILKNINHPILPQLDYSSLNITVANPAINRSSVRSVCDEQVLSTISCNGFGCAPSLSSVNFVADTSHEESGSKHLFLNKIDNDYPQFSKLHSNLEPGVTNVPASPKSIMPVRKSEIDVTFAIPEKKSIAYTTFCDGKSIPELDVDFPITTSVLSSPSNFVSSQFRRADFPEIRKSDASGIKNFSMLPKPSSNLTLVSYLSNNAEPRSLDLPSFAENSAPVDDDEFTEFQSATIPITEEYSDFQSSSPIAKYEMNNLSKDLLQVNITTDSVSHKTESEELYSLNEDRHIHKTLLEADKYDVFRTLIEPEKNERQQVSSEQEDEDEADEEDDFGNFFAADVKPERDIPIRVSFSIFTNHITVTATAQTTYTYNTANSTPITL